MSPVRIGMIFTSVVSVLCASSNLNAATVTIRPTNLNAEIRLNGNVVIVQAVNANNQAVNANATIQRRATGEVDVTINDPNVRAITIVVTAGDALAANEQNVLVIDQTVSIALPNADQAPCYSCYKRRGLFRRH
jgi:hypothetical protein